MFTPQAIAAEVFDATPLSFCDSAGLREAAAIKSLVKQINSTGFCRELATMLARIHGPHFQIPVSVAIKTSASEFFVEDKRGTMALCMTAQGVRVCGRHAVQFDSREADRFPEGRPFNKPFRMFPVDMRRLALAIYPQISQIQHQLHELLHEVVQAKLPQPKR